MSNTAADLVDRVLPNVPVRSALTQISRLGRLGRFRRSTSYFARYVAGRYAANVEDFHRELRLAPDDVLRHHALRGDFSRWISDVVRDSVLALEIRMLEGELDVEVMRDSLVEVIERRYGDNEAPRVSRNPAP